MRNVYACYNLDTVHSWLCQIIVNEPGGPSADEFLFRVQEAAAGPPWYLDDPPVVGIYLITTRAQFR